MCPGDLVRIDFGGVIGVGSVLKERTQGKIGLVIEHLVEEGPGTWSEWSVLMPDRSIEAFFENELVVIQNAEE